MSTLALPGKFQVTFNQKPDPEVPDWLQIACLLIGFAFGACLATCFPLFR